MSKLPHTAADYCQRLAVHGSGHHGSSLSVPPSETQKTDSASAYPDISCDIPFTGKTTPELGLGDNVSFQPQSSESQKTDSTYLESEKMTPAKPELGLSSLKPVHPDPGLFNLEKWILGLNNSLLDHQGDKAAQISLLTHARQACDDYVRRLTNDFKESEAHMKPLLQKPASKKVQKKAIRLLDAELMSVNRQVEQVHLVRREVERCLRQVCREDQLQPILVQVLGELQKPSMGRRQAGLWGFFGDVLLYVVLTLLVLFLLAFIMHFISTD